MSNMNVICLCERVTSLDPISCKLGRAFLQKKKEGKKQTLRLILDLDVLDLEAILLSYDHIYPLHVESSRSSATLILADADATAHLLIEQQKVQHDVVNLPSNLVQALPSLLGQNHCSIRERFQ